MRFGSQSGSMYNRIEEPDTPRIFVQYAVPKTPREREIEASQIRSYASKNAYHARKSFSARSYSPPSQYPTITEWFPESVAKAQRPITRRFRVQQNEKHTGNEKNTTSLHRKSTTHASYDLKPSPKSVLSDSPSDPFYLFNTVTSDTWTQENINHCTRVLWPGLRTEEFHYSAYGHSILSCIGRSPMLMAAMLFSAAVHRDVLRISGSSISQSDSRILFYYKGKAMAMLRAKLSDTIWLPNVLDDLILSAFFLAVNEGNADISIDLPDPSAFSPSLATTQWIRLYRLQAIDLRHWRAVVVLIEKRGGIHNISLRGAAWVISLAALMLGATTLCVPEYSPMDSDGRVSIYIAPLLHLDPVPVARHKLRPAHGFHYLCTLGVRLNLLQPFLNLSELSQALHILSIQQCSQLQTDQLIDCRNIVTYRVLTLLRVERNHVLQEDFSAGGHNTAQSGQACNLFHLLRLTAILFTLQVIYPLPRIAKIRSTLLSQLRGALRDCDSACLNTEEQEILLWCALIGAISADAEDPVSSKWFASHVAKSSVMLSIDNYAQLTNLMQQFAWVDTACNTTAQKIWKRLKSD